MPRVVKASRVNEKTKDLRNFLLDPGLFYIPYSERDEVLFNKPGQGCGTIRRQDNESAKFSGTLFSHKYHPPEKITTNFITNGSKIPGDLQYDAAFTEESFKRSVESLLRYLNTFPAEVKINIYGHTDTVGGEAQNLQLSAKRAASFRDYLLDKTYWPELYLKDPSQVGTVKGEGQAKHVAAQLQEWKSKNPGKPENDFKYKEINDVNFRMVTIEYIPK